jgi:nucleotide-binding universal stress UspA family protein
MTTALVAVDFSHATRSVLREARRFARQARCRLLLVNVVRLPAPVPNYLGIMPDTPESIDAERSAAERHLRRLCASLRRSGLQASSLVGVGNPGRELLQAAKAAPATYIIVGSHGHSLIHNLVMGSTTSAVLHRARCPVVVVDQTRGRRAVAART